MFKSIQRILLVSTLSAVALGACSSSESLPDPEATGRELVTEFLSLLSTEEAPGLEEFLAEGFQLQRADGTGATKDEYLVEHSVVKSFELGDELVAVQDGDVLTVRWSVAVDSTISGEAQSTADAPRLSVFVRSGSAWKLIAHSNFNSPS